MSTPPNDGDNFSPYFDPDRFNEDDEVVEWLGKAEPPQWFIDTAELFWQLDHRESVFLQVDAGNNPEYHQYHSDGTYSVPILAIDNDTGEQIPILLDHMTYEDLMDFYYYTMDNYDDIAFWPDGGSGDLGAF